MTEATPINVRVTYAVDATINIGNFENVKPHYAISADVPEGASPTEVRNKLKAVVNAWLEQDIIEHKEEAAR